MDDYSLLGPATPNLGLFGPQPVPAPGPVPGVQMTPTGISAPAPQAAPLPSPLLAPTQGKQSLLGKVHDFLLKSLGGGAPLGYEDLLSPDEIKSAQPSLLQAIFTHNPTQTAAVEQGKLDHILQLRQLEMGMGLQGQILATRRAIVKQYPLPTSGNEADMAQWAQQVFPMLLAAGDKESLAALTPLLEKYATQPKVPPTRLFKDPQGNLHSLPNNIPDVPAGWTPVQTAGAGVPQLFRAKDGTEIWVQPGQPVPQGAVPEHTAVTQFVQGGVNDRSTRAYNASQLSRFRAAVKPQTDRASIIDQALTTINDAATNPDPNLRKTLYSSAIANFVQAADQKAQLRFQLLNYYEHNVDPSIAGKWNVLKSRLLNGQLPAYTMQAMMEHLGHLRAMTRTEIENQRQQYISADPTLDPVLPATDSFFPYSGGTTVATPGAPAAGYSPNNPFAKRKP
jgi:hypothetical protein